MSLTLNKPKLDNLADEMWKSAERLRGKFKPYEYQNVVLPIIVIRRLECVLIKWREEKAAEVLAKRPKLTEKELAKLVKGLETEHGPVLQQDRLDAAPSLRGGPYPPRRELPRLHQRVLEERRRHHRALQLPGHHRSDGEEQPAGPDPEPVQGAGTRPGQALAAGDGLHLRGAAAALLGTERRGGRRALHAARGHPPDGGAARHPDPRQAPLHLRSGLRHGRNAVGGEGTPSRPRRHAGGAGAGREVRDSPRAGAVAHQLRHLPGRPADQERPAGQGASRQLADPARSPQPRAGRPVPRVEVPLRLHALQSALRRDLGRQGRLRGRGAQAGEDSLPGRDAARERRRAALPADHAGQDEAAGEGRQPHRHHLQRLAALQRRLRPGRERDPPLDSGERLARRHRHAARPTLLQHRHLHLHLAAAERQAGHRTRAA